MNFFNIKPLALITLLSVCHRTGAAELGDMEVMSGIDEKLNADIPLVLAPQENTANTRVKIISSQYRQPNNSITTEPKIEINNDEGRLQITSKQTIQSPQLDIVLEVKTDKSTQYKQFSIDLSRANEDSPLIVSPKNSRPKNQEPAQTVKARLRKKSPTTPIAQVPVPPPTVVTPEAAPITSNTQPLAEAPQLQTSEIKLTTTPIIATPEQPVSPQKNGFQDNLLIVIAFLTGILGVLGLQSLWSGKTKASNRAHAARSSDNETYSSVVDTESATDEDASSTQSSIELSDQVVLFEQLLAKRLQQLKADGLAEARQPEDSVASELADLGDDEFGFDFDLPEYRVDQKQVP